MDEKDVDETTDDSSQSDESAEAGPPEDIEKDPAYNPDDEGMKGIKGG